MSDLQNAVAEFVRIWDDPDVSEDVGERLKCLEVESIVDLLRAAGCEDVEHWLRNHATEFCEEDMEEHLAFVE